MEGNVAIRASRARRLMRLDNGRGAPRGQPAKAVFPKGFMPGMIRLSRCESGVMRENQLFSSGLIFLANSSNEVSPLIFSPLMKKVGVESTFSTSLAYFWSATSLSSKA
jgi:hypothetical protein